MRKYSKPLPSARETRLSRPKTTAATGAEPYVAMSVSWLAPSSRSGPTMFGTEASLAGIQNRLTVSMRNDATSRCTSAVPRSATEPTIGIDRNSRKRSRSQTTMVVRRSQRSAKAPASGPNSTAGSSRNTSTPPVANALPSKESTSWAASAVVARKPSQSPKLDSTSAV